MCRRTSSKSVYSSAFIDATANARQHSEARQQPISLPLVSEARAGSIARGSLPRTRRLMDPQASLTLIQVVVLITTGFQGHVAGLHIRLIVRQLRF